MNKNKLISIFLVAAFAATGSLTSEAIKKVNTPKQENTKQRKSGSSKRKNDSNSSKSSNKGISVAEEAPVETFRNDDTDVRDYLINPYAYYEEIYESWNLMEYEEFLQKYPDSYYSKEIRDRKNEILMWLRAQKSNSISAYQNYLDNSEYLEYADEAEMAIERLMEEASEKAWSKAQKQNTIEGYDAFIKEHPDSKFIDEAKKQKDELMAQAEWRRLKGSHNIDAYEIFLMKYPNFWGIAEVQSELYAEMGLRETNRDNLVKGYQYFEKVPNYKILQTSRYSEAYRRAKEEANFNNLSSKSPEYALREFLTNYPDSPHTEEVKNYLALKLANSFGLNTKDYDYEKALGYATGETRKTVKDMIKANQRYQKKKGVSWRSTPLPPYSGYAEVFLQLGQYMGIGASLGGFYNNINAEVEFTKGLANSKNIYWYENNELMAKSKYSSWCMDLKVGYKFDFKQKFRVVPQLGFGYLKCTSSVENPAKGANSEFGLIGVRINYIFAEHMEVTLAPVYNFSLRKSPGFNEISQLQKGVGNWSNGINFKLGFSVIF